MTGRGINRLLPTRVVRLLQAGLFDLLGLRWTLATGVQLRVRSLTDWTLYNDIFVDGEYDDAIRALIERSEGGKPALVIDLGANVGFFELRLFHLLGLAGVSPEQLRVIAVEPSPANLEEMKIRLWPQGSWSACVEIVPGLVGSKKSGAASLFESHNYGMNTVVDGLKYPGSRRIEVGYIDIDAFLPGDEAIHLLKCDIEGAELDFVKSYGSLLSRVGLAVFEVHHSACDVVELNRQLDAAGLAYEQVVVNRGGTSIRVYSREPLPQR